MTSIEVHIDTDRVELLHGVDGAGFVGRGGVGALGVGQVGNQVGKRVGFYNSHDTDCRVF